MRTQPSTETRIAKRRVLSFSARLLLAAILLATGVPSGKADEKAGKPVPLLTTQTKDGNFEGWECFSEQPGMPCGEVWRMEAGVLICKGTPKGYLYTRKSFTDFVLQLQWRWPAGKTPGKGGVLVRMTGPDKIWPKSLEAQINTGQAGDFWGLDGYALEGPPGRSQAVEHPSFGALINVPKLFDAEKSPGEWNQYEIIAEGEKVTLKINGKVVNEATRCDAGPGRISLTAEGDEIHFRDIQLIEKEDRKPAP